MKFKQNSFIGGLSRRLDPTRLERDKYFLLINGRNRFDTIRPIKRSSRLDGLQDCPTGGNFQSIYGVGSYLFVFWNGDCYYKDFNYPNSSFNLVPNFQLDPAVDKIFLETVPASTINLYRTLSSSNNVDSIVYSSVIPGSKSAIICQDGISRPQLIQNDLMGRTVGNYDNWTTANREYVPIGGQMLHQDGILYVVSPDKKRIYRSVSGRPLDFMVVIDAAGNKLATEAEGGAEVVSHAVDYEQISCISRLNSGDGGFFVSTSRNSWKVVPLVTEIDLVFGEPTFQNVYLFGTGSRNHKSFIELLGDAALIDYSGLRSFNAVQNYQVEGKNSPFSQEISDIFEKLQQLDPCCVNFDNYGYFFMDTIFGKCNVVYDTITETFVSLDFLSDVTNIKQFAEVKTDAGRKLFYLADNRLYEAFSANNVENCQIYVGEWASDEPFVEQKPQIVKLVFSNIYTSGTINATLFVDGKEIETVPQQVTANSTEIVSPVEIPFGDKDNDKVEVLPFEFKAPRVGWKFGILIDFNGVDAVLSHVGIESSDNTFITPQQTAVTNAKTLNDRIRERVLN